MAVISSIFTADTNLNRYNVSISKRVDADSLLVDDYATTLYDSLIKNYKKAEKQYTKLAQELIKAKSKVKGSKLKSQMTKAAKRAQNQGKYCSNRAKDLQVLFTFALTKKHIDYMEMMLKSSSGK